MGTKYAWLVVRVDWDEMAQDQWETPLPESLYFNFSKARDRAHKEAWDVIKERDVYCLETDTYADDNGVVTGLDIYAVKGDNCAIKFVVKRLECAPE